MHNHIIYSVFPNIVCPMRALTTLMGTNFTCVIITVVIVEYCYGNLSLIVTIHEYRNRLILSIGAVFVHSFIHLVGLLVISVARFQ